MPSRQQLENLVQKQQEVRALSRHTPAPLCWACASKTWCSKVLRSLWGFLEAGRRRPALNDVLGKSGVVGHCPAQALWRDCRGTVFSSPNERTTERLYLGGQSELPPGKDVLCF